MKKLRVDVWSDIACPWCHVGKRHLEVALERFHDTDEVEVLWRAFELDPRAPREVDVTVPYVDRLAKKYRCSREDAQAMMDRLTKSAADDGLELRFDRMRPGNTFDAHRVLHLAGKHGKQDAVNERFLRGYLADGEPIGKPDVIERMAVEAGLDPEEVRTTLAGDAYGDDVREDEREAHELGIRGVPFFVIGGRYAVSGAQPTEVIHEALEHAWRELVPTNLIAVGDEEPAAVCGPDGCAVPQR